MHLNLLKKVDYKTLLFFIGLFIVVGGLEETGILEYIAQFIESISHGNVMLMIAIILWISAIASAFVDNIPFAATMVPVIQSLAATSGVDISTLAWALSIGTDIGGSATPIGASANVVGTSVAAKERLSHRLGKILCKACTRNNNSSCTFNSIHICKIFMIYNQGGFYVTVNYFSRQGVRQRRQSYR